MLPSKSIYMDAWRIFDECYWQESVEKWLIEKLEGFVTNAKVSDNSHSFIPFYDTVLPAEKKNMLGQVKMHSVIENKVQALN